MSFLLANFLGTNSPDLSTDKGESKQILIEKLIAKMINSAHLEDRKAAAQTIKSLARSHRLEIGTLALQSLLDELKRDFEDVELAKIVLETLDILCSSVGSNVNGNEEKENEDEKIKNEDGIEVQFCEILLKNDENVSLLLESMGESDFYLRFTSIQILISLCKSQPFQLQSAVIAAPAGVSKILDLLQDSREIIRNEGLLFCAALVRDNADLQKIVAFQGAFEQVMKIIVEENGTWDGALIVQDGLNLISSLLLFNTSNQIYFRDSICFKQLAGLLAIPSDCNEEEKLWNRTRSSNFLEALKVLDGLLCKENVDLEASQNSALKTNYLKPLLILAFTPRIPLKVSASALKCLSGLIWSNSRAQQDFSREKLTQIPIASTLKISFPCSPLMAAILVALHGNVGESSDQRSNALNLVAAFCSGNTEGQLVLISTLKGIGTISPGTAILEALFDFEASRKRDPWHCWYAAALLCHLISGSDEAKKTLLSHQLNNSDLESHENSEDVDDILTSIMLNLIRITRDSCGSTCQKSIVGYLQLLVIWFNESSESVKRFLEEGSFVQYLIERITQSTIQDMEIQGLSALILGLCVLYNDESSSAFNSESLKGIIKNRIGPDLFLNRLSRLKNERDENLIIELTDEILRKNYESLINLVARPTPAGGKASHTATLAQLTKDLNQCRTLLNDTQSHLIQNSTLAETLKIGISERDSYILQLQKIISEKNQRIAQMAHEMSNFEQQQQQQQKIDLIEADNNSSQNQEGIVKNYYERYLSDQAALQNLKETLKSFQATVHRQQTRIEELENLLKTSRNGNLLETDKKLEESKEAYHKMYDQVQQQLNFNLSENGDVVEVKQQNYEHEHEKSLHNPEQKLNENFKSTENLSAEIKELENENVTINSNISSENFDFLNVTSNTTTDIEILSPSLFMSPLADESKNNDSPLIIETSENENENENNPELKSFNTIPETGYFNEYPKLTDYSEISCPAALIVPEKFETLKQESQSLEQITTECPPDNFLASETDDEAPVSNEEIRQVLDFFDQLPEPPKTQLEDSLNENELGSLQEGLEHLQFEDQSYNENENLIENNSVESFKNNFEFQGHEQEEQYLDQQVPEFVSGSFDDINSFNPISSVEKCQDYEQVDFNNNENENSGCFEQIYQENNQNDASNENQEYSYENQDQSEAVNEFEYQQSEEFNDNLNVQDYSYDQSQSKYQEQEQYQEYYNEEQPEQVYDQNGNYYYDQAQTNQVYAHDPFLQEQLQEQSQEYTEEQSQEYLEKQSQEYPEEQSQEYPEEQSQKYPEEQSQEYSEEQSYEQSQEYSQDQTQEFIQEQLHEQSNEYEYPQEFTHEQSQEYSQEQSYEYPETQTFAHEKVEYNQENDQVQEYSNDQVQEYTQDQAQEYTQDQAQEYNQDQAQEYNQDQAQYYENDLQFSDNQQIHKTEYGYESYPEQSEQSQLPQEQQENQSEYYYYDEATGYTYGFDHNVNQYYYYDPNTCEYTYYTTDEQTGTETQTQEQDKYQYQETDNIPQTLVMKNDLDEKESSLASIFSNPSLFDTKGPPIIPLQQPGPLNQNFAADQIYNL